MATNNSVDANDATKVSIRDDAEQYSTYKTQVQSDNIRFLERYKSKIKWKQSGARIIDVGCGDGGMTNILETHAPPKYELLLGCDMNPNMVKYANEKYGKDRMKFRVLNAEGDLPSELRESFDHVFSFHMLAFIKNQKKVFKNFYDLLVPGGDFFVVFTSRNVFYDAFRALAAMDFWSPLFTAKDNFPAPFFDYQEPDKVISDMMEEVGFKSVEVITKQMISVHQNLDFLKNNIYYLSPFFDRKELKDRFMEDVDAIYRGLQLVHRLENGGEIVKCPHNCMIIYATK